MIYLLWCVCFYRFCGVLNIRVWFIWLFRLINCKLLFTNGNKWHWILWIIPSLLRSFLRVARAFSGRWWHYSIFCHFTFFVGLFELVLQWYFCEISVLILYQCWILLDQFCLCCDVKCWGDNLSLGVLVKLSWSNIIRLYLLLLVMMCLTCFFISILVCLSLVLRLLWVWLVVVIV